MISAWKPQEVPVQQRFKLPDEDLDPKYKNFMDKAYSDRLGAGTEKNTQKCHGQFGGSPSVCWFSWQGFFPISKMEKRMCFFHERLLLWMMD